MHGFSKYKVISHLAIQVAMKMNYDKNAKIRNVVYETVRCSRLPFPIPMFQLHSLK